MSKRMHITEKGSTTQLDACSNCFTICHHNDYFCSQCGVRFDEEDAYGIDDLLEQINCSQPATPEEGKP